MKKQLLKKLTFLFALFGALSLSAQNFTFDSDLEGFTENFGPNGVVAWDADGGNGALKLTRSSNNANFGRSDGGGIDATATPYIKIRIKNLTSGRHLRIGGTGGDATAGNFDFFNLLTAEAGYATYYLDMSAQAFWNGNLTNFWVAVRANFGAPADSDGAYIDSIELLSTLPPDEFSEFVKNPNFDDTSGIAHITGSQAEFTRAIDGTEMHNGANSMTMTFDKGDATKINWNFSSYEHIFPTAFSGAHNVTVTMWVKTNRTGATAPFRIVQRTRTSLGDSSVPGNQVRDINGDYPWDSATSTNTTGDWEQLTFNYEVPASFDQGTFWFAVDFDGTNTDLNMSNGDIIYFDEISVNITPLSIKGNTLEGVSAYPNPARDVLTLKTPRGGDITVFNILGAEVKTDKTDLKEYRMNVSDLKSGVYLLRVNSDGKQFTQKLVID